MTTYLFLVESQIYENELASPKKVPPTKEPEKKEVMTQEFKDELVAAGKIMREG